jgi:4-hydroxybutyrate CoA-transferase
MTAAASPATDWREHYRQRLVSAEEAAARVGPGASVYVPVGQMVGSVIRALVARGPDLEGVTVTGLPGVDYGWFAPEFAGRLTVNTIFATPATRDALERGLADYTPCPLWGFHKGLDEGREEARPIDVNLISCTPPNEHGYVCLGTAVWDAPTCVRRAKVNIAVVNAHLPRTFGDTWLPVSAIDWFVEDHTPLPELPARAYPDPDPWDAPIAGYVSTLVRDDDTIQIGTGSTTGNLIRCGALADKHDLGYFGELTVPGTIDLVRQGVITGRKMALHPGKFVTATAGNSAADRAFINDNPMFEFYAVDYIHDPRVIARHDRYVAINNALAVDLTGQIAASTIGPRVYSGTGGHLCFAMGAYLARGGRYVCVLPATALAGTTSRIVPQFEAGQVVTVPRDIADTVVTEYGIARLLNRSVRERAEALISIAHPDFRAELRREARKLFWASP